VTAEACTAGTAKPVVQCKVQEIWEGVATLQAWAMGKPDLGLTRK
jgi:hypothetical protein